MPSIQRQKTIAIKTARKSEEESYLRLFEDVTLNVEIIGMNAMEANWRHVRQHI